MQIYTFFFTILLEFFTLSRLFTSTFFTFCTLFYFLTPLRCIYKTLARTFAYLNRNGDEHTHTHTHRGKADELSWWKVFNWRKAHLHATAWVGVGCSRGHMHTCTFFIYICTTVLTYVHARLCVCTFVSLRQTVCISLVACCKHFYIAQYFRPSGGQEIEEHEREEESRSSALSRQSLPTCCQSGANY